MSARGFIDGRAMSSLLIALFAAGVALGSVCGLGVGRASCNRGAVTRVRILTRTAAECVAVCAPSQPDAMLQTCVGCGIDCRCDVPFPAPPKDPHAR